MTATTPDALVRPPGAATYAALCFHCGLPLGSRAWTVLVDGVSRDTCCRGCQAVAGLISAQGLSAYYRNRAALPPTLEGDNRPADVYADYDLAQVQAGYVLRRADGLHEVALLLEGVTCAACLWLIEQRLVQLDGVQTATANHGTRRLRVTWDASRVKLSAILSAIAGLGYQAHLYNRERSEAVLVRERRTLLWQLFVAAFGMMQVMMYAFPAYVAQDDIPADIERLMQFAGLALTLPVMIWSALPFYRGAWRGWRARAFNRDVPVVIGIVVAFAASVGATLSGQGAVYYDSITMFVFLLLGARYLELRARTFAAREQDRVARLVPAMAVRLTQFPDRAVRDAVPVAALQCGDVVEIRPGAPAPGDGVVVEGAGNMNEALLTGESRPQSKAPGSGVIAGSVNGDSALAVRLTHTGEQTTVAGIVRLMDRALETRPRLASIADRMASHFVFALLVVTAVSAAVWWVVDRERVLWVTISLLVVTCPCALSLATPAALTAATGSLARRGILITRGHALEALAGATHFVFDKTGTLTAGRMHLIGVLTLASLSREAVTGMAAALEAVSEHPAGRALAAADTLPPRYHASGLRYVAGQGVEGVIDGMRLRVGSPNFVAGLTGTPLPADMVFVNDDVTTVALGSAGSWLALFTLGDTLRPGARRVVHELVEQEYEVHLLSGDRAPCVQRTAQRLGISTASGEATPADKLVYVRKLQGQGASVAMVGDGVNDAPVLAQAQVSVAMASGTELARVNADVALLADGIEPLLDAVTTARRTLAIVRQNFIWAVVYNAVAVPLAVMGLVTPLVAAAGMSVSSLLVIGNALRLCDNRTRAPARSAGSEG